MVTKRELAQAQQALNGAVRVFLDSYVGKQGGPVPPLDYFTSRSRLRDAFDAWDDLRRQLDGQGPAVARSTSIAAAKANIMLKQSVRREILTLVVREWNIYRRGMTADEILARMGGRHQTISARVSELAKTYELLKDSGRKRNTSLGHKAIVWEPTNEAIALVRAAVTGRTDA